ncbi:MAG: hypothetical protein DELT_03132 [Desulfovibrio sp.]
MLNVPMSLIGGVLSLRSSVPPYMLSVPVSYTVKSLSLKFTSEPVPLQSQRVSVPPSSMAKPSVYRVAVCGLSIRVFPSRQRVTVTPLGMTLRLLPRLVSLGTYTLASCGKTNAPVLLSL